MSEEYMREGFVTPFGRVLGVFQGVEGRSNGSDHHFSALQNYENGVYTGYKYQCVEFGRRWLLSKGLELNSVPFAAHIWNMRVVERVSDDKPTTVKPVPNGSSTPPVPESFLIWKIADDVPFGHIAVITEVSIEDKFVRIAEQNVDNDYWPGNYARQLKLDIEDGKYWIRDEDEIYGWMVINFDVDSQDPRDLAAFENPVERHVVRNPGKVQSKNEIEQKFDEVWGNAYDSAESTSFYTLESCFASKIQYATMECGFAGNRATKYVLEHPEIHEKFGLPAWSWDFIRKEFDRYWNSDGKVIAGRMEFVHNGRHLKVVRLYGDCLEGLAESCYFQDVLAERLGVEVGKSPQGNLYQQLVDQIKYAIFTHVHVLASGQRNEGYLIPFLQKALSDAGVVNKVITSGTYSKNDEGKFVDSDGEEIKTVWKTENWTSILSKAPNSLSENPILELLLSDHITTFEPIWRVVASSPAIIPVMHSNSPQNIYLQAADWSISPNLEGKQVEEVRYSSNGQEFSYFREKFERQNFNGHTPLIESWNLGSRLTGFSFSEEGLERLPVYCTRILNDD